MTARQIIFLGAVGIVIVGGGVLAFWHKSPVKSPAGASTRQRVLAIAPAAIAAPKPPMLALTSYPQISRRAMSRDQATAVYLRRLGQDPTSEGRVELNFYGKVIDEVGRAVSGATAYMQWNTVGVVGGTAYAQAVSDSNGLFSLTNQTGKVIGIRVEKQGYYTVDGGLGDLSFEYADPSSPNYNEPDPNKPVIFHLRRKGEGAKLFVKVLNLPVSSRHPQARVNLMQGFFKPDGGLTITFDTSKYVTSANAFPWTVTLSMNEGGLVETDDPFPFTAPAVGYTPTVTMEMTNLDRSVWRGNMTKSYYFYLPSTNTYGRLTLDAESAARSTLTYAYNMTPGNRTLEPAQN
jgi:hypothetical protein